MRVYPKWKLGAPSLSLYQSLDFGGLQAAPSLAWSCPQYAISDGDFGWHGANYCTPPVRLQYSGSLWVRTHYMPKHVPTYRLALCGGVF